MRKSLWLVFAFVLVAGILAACSGAAAPAPAPTTAPAAQKPAEAPKATEAPKPAEAPKATEAPKPAATAAPAAKATDAPKTEPTKPPAPPTATIQPTVIFGDTGAASGRTRILWYIGLGAGADKDVIPKEQAWVEKFNKSQDKYQLVMQVVTNPQSYDTLKAMIAAGNPPDIVGPVGKAGRASFTGAWLDIAPLAQKAGFKLDAYDKTLLDFTKDEGVQVGIPFALFPSFVYFNKALFDEARLPYPPQKVGDKYQGKDWNLDTFAELSKKLTVDKNGADATDPKFDPKTIKQFGSFIQFTDARGVAVLYGGGLPVDDKNNAVIPDNWVKAWKWYYDAVWKGNFMPNNDYQQSDLLAKGNPFSSGNVAMAMTHTWYTCCFDMKKLKWDIAVMPTVDGKITAKLHGDTFAIMKGSKNPDAAFEIMSKMVVDKELYQIYGGMPAKIEDQAEFFKTFDERTVPNKITWSVAQEMLKYPDLPNHEAGLPNLVKANDLFGKFRTTLDSQPNLNVDQEIAKLKSDLDAAYKSAPK